jgi:hypothetical protein
MNPTVLVCATSCFVVGLSEGAVALQLAAPELYGLLWASWARLRRKLRAEHEKQAVIANSSMVFPGHCFCCKPPGMQVDSGVCRAYKNHRFIPKIPSAQRSSLIPNA